MLLAIFASSCNKYADDFDQINTKLDALATSVAGVAQLTTDMSALKSQVTALQAAVASLPTKAQTDASFAALTTSLSGITTKVDAITTALAAVATSGNATKAVVDQLKLDLAALATKVTNDNAAMTTQLNGLAADNVTMKANLQTIIAANTALATQITAVQDQITALVGDTSTAAATDVTIKGLQLMLDAQKITLDQLLANSNMYNGSVSITSDAEVAFWLPKIGVWKDGGMINGSFTVNASTITKLTDLKTITDNILAVIGGTGSQTTIISTASQHLTFAKLASVTGHYIVIGADVDDSKLTSVGGTVALNYDGGYDQPALATAGAIAIQDYTTNAAATPAVVGTVKVDFSGLTTATSIQTDAVSVNPSYVLNALTGTAGTVAFASATSVALGQVPYLSVTANAANTVNLAYSPSGGVAANVAVNATKAASAITLGIVKTTANLDITGSATSTVSLPNLTIVAGTTGITALTLTADKVTTLTGAVTLTSVTPVSLPKLATAGTINAATATAFTAPLLNVSANLTLDVAKDVRVLSTTQALLPSSVAENLTIDALSVAFTSAAASTLKTVNITGKAASSGAFTYTVPATAADSKLVSATFGGELDAVVVNGFGAATDKLTSVTTSGAIDAFTLNNSDVITSLGLGHTHISGGPGSSVIITNNAKLASLTTSTDKLHYLVITGNAKLAALNLASYTTLLNHDAANDGSAANKFDVTVTINTNALVGSFTAAVAATPTTAYTEASIVSTDLTTLKSYLLGLWPASPTLTSNIALNVDDVDPDVAVVQTLSAAMGLNAAVSDAIDATTGINSKAEVAIIQ